MPIIEGNTTDLLHRSLMDAILHDDEIAECNCLPLMGRKYRESYFENPLLENIEKLFTQNKTLNITSIGSGRCFQELSLCFRLAEKGYTVNRFVIIDPWYFDKDYHEIISIPAKFKKYFTDLFPTGLVTVFSKEKHYKNALENHRIPYPDFFLSVDMDKWTLDERIERCAGLLKNSDTSCFLAYYDKNLDGNLDERMDKESCLHIQKFEEQGQKGLILSHQLYQYKK